MFVVYRRDVQPIHQAPAQYENPRAPFATTITTALFSFLLFFLLVARIGSMHDDAGKWSFDLVADRLRSVGKSVGESLSAFWDMTGPQRAVTLGQGITVISFARRK